MNTEIWAPMKFLIGYLYFDTAISDSELLSALPDSAIHYDVIDATDSLYRQCASLNEIEAQHEGMHNYPDEHNEATWPAFRLKVLKIEPL